MTKKYIVVKNQHGEFAIQNTEIGVVVLEREEEKFCREWADKMNRAQDDVWTPVDPTAKPE